MLRLRLASLALASSLLLTLSGCCSFCQDGQLFPRLFRNTSWRGGGAVATEGVDCECHRGHWPKGMEVPPGQGPFLAPPGASFAPPPPIPITNVPVAQPPQTFKVPQAPPTAYVPGN